ncbi:hypothetical protein [Pontibacter arcticus]|uniref:Uncharacterized protein n=1 Tax=Pontibacter arcticus TaxID=2080288 RepID=A0A364RE94_9BACT|nr:hypothetical protein [Pontibacter arcticus]RAU82613.1 hypothetical protein DP923_12675 [Pontibacter arcticus]
MKKIIKERAEDLCVYWWTNHYDVTISSCKSDVETTIQEFYLTQEKLKFLQYLESAVQEDKDHHLKTCDDRNCLIEKGLAIALYVLENESKNLQVLTEEANSIPSDIQEIKDKIDVIIEELKKANVGNEILFDELIELKDLSKSLKKKNWTEVAKGKLIDLVLNKVIEKDTLDYIIKSLTGDSINLLN